MAEYLSAAETAVMVRAALKRNFPGVKFSVRSHTYSGGASIRISWTDGPRTSSVDAIAQRFAGADFDGMQDLKTSKTTILADEQRVREVRFGSDFVFCSRTESRFDELKAEAEQMIRERCVLEKFGQFERFGGHYVSDLANAMVRSIDFYKGETLEQTFRRVVCGEAA